MRIRGRFILLVLGAALTALVPAPAAAVDVAGLYEGRVAVAGEEAAEREAALGRALRQVIGKLTGLREPGGAVVEAAVAQPQAYLQQFRYLEDRGGEMPLVLWARFDPLAVDALLRDSGLPVWGAQRPAVLTWLVVARGEGLEIASPEVGDPVALALERRAWERGVPLTFPLLDLEDRVRLRPADLWSLDRALVAEASARYAPGAVLVGRVEPTGAGAWSARWWLEDPSGTSEWHTASLSAAAAAPAAVDALADRFAARYALVAAEGDGLIQVQVSGVRGVNDYARALGYLQGLDQVLALELAAARTGELSFRMQVRGGSEALRRLAAFGGVLAAEPVAEEGGALRFRLLP